MNSRKSLNLNAVYIITFSALIVMAGAHWGSVQLGLFLIFLLGMLIIVQMLGKVERNIKRHQDNLFKQQECKTQLEHYMACGIPLPYTRGYRGSPDFLLEVYQHIIKYKPKNIVEASSGLSTLVCAQALKNLGEGGKVNSLEHEALYAEMTTDLVKEYNLNNIATVLHAPLVSHNIAHQEWLWYDISAVTLPAEIDMIIVDGPPRRTQKNARYPALTLLFDRLSNGGILLLDDANRAAEQATVAQWQQAYPNIKVTRVALEKGMTIIEK